MKRLVHLPGRAVFRLARPFAAAKSRIDAICGLGDASTLRSRTGGFGGGTEGQSDGRAGMSFARGPSGR